MKIAICFSGGIRSFLTCYPSIFKNVVMPLNPDIFFHLWSQPIYKNYDASFNNFKFQEDECSQQKVYEILNQENKVKDFVIDEYSEDWQDYIIKNCIDPDIINKLDQKDKDYAISAICMYYKIQKANDLKINYENKNNFKYDLVIRARLDFIWNQQFKLEDFSFNNNEIILIKDSYCTKAKWEGNDKFFASNSYNMDKICDLYKNIKYFHTELNIPLEGQHLNRHIIKYLNLKIKFIGNQNTYDKILASKRIRINGLVCFVHDCLDNLGFIISEDFLKRGYKVIGITDNDIDNDNFKILNKYNHFQLSIDYTNIFASFFIFTKEHNFIEKIIAKRVVCFVNDKKEKTNQIKNIILIDTDQSINIKNLNKIILDKNNCDNYNLSNFIDISS